MNSNFWWIYDIIFIAAAVLSIYSCAKKGFSKIVILVVGCVVSIFLASFVSSRCSEFIYEKFVRQSSIDAVKETMEEYVPALSVKDAIESQDYGVVLDEGKVDKILRSEDPVEMLYEYTNQAAGAVVGTPEEFTNALTTGFSERFARQLGVGLPPYVLRELTEKLPGNYDLFVETTTKILKSPGNVPEYIEKNYIREPAMKLVSAFVFVISYFIFMLIIRVVVYRTVSLGLLNGYDRLDRIVGGVFGIVQAAVLLVIIAVIVRILIHVAESKDSFISYEAVEKTKLFKYAFDLTGKY